MGYARNCRTRAPTPYAIRDELTDMVVRDLLGPADGLEEEVHQSEVNALGRYRRYSA